MSATQFKGQRTSASRELVTEAFSDFPGGKERLAALEVTCRASSSTRGMVHMDFLLHSPTLLLCTPSVAAPAPPPMTGEAAGTQELYLCVFCLQCTPTKDLPTTELCLCPEREPGSCANLLRPTQPNKVGALESMGTHPYCVLDPRSQAPRSQASWTPSAAQHGTTGHTWFLSTWLV